MSKGFRVFRLDVNKSNKTESIFSQNQINDLSFNNLKENVQRIAESYGILTADLKLNELYYITNMVKIIISMNINYLWYF